MLTRITRKSQVGITLIEVIITFAIIGILAAMAIPSFKDQFENRRLKGAAESLFGSLQNAKAEAIKTNTPIRVVFSTTTINTLHSTWCFGMTTAGTNTCDCDASSHDCTPGSVIDSSDFRNISVTFDDDNTRGFDPLRGNSIDASGSVSASNGIVTFSAGNNKTIGVNTFPIGRIKVCKPGTSTFSDGSGDCE